MRRRLGRSLLLAVAVAAALVPLPVRSQTVPQAARGLLVPTGFAATAFAEIPGRLPTSITWGPDTRDGQGARFYVVSIDGSLANGMIHVFDEGSPQPQVFASGVGLALGLAFGPDNTAYVTTNASRRGSVLALTDADKNGAAEQRRTVLKNIPNDRHQTNGLEFGPDGMLYVTNGNTTDDGIEDGTPEVPPWTGSLLRVDPAWNDVDLLKDVTVDDNGVNDDGLDDEDVVVAVGMRNLYDVAFSPRDASVAYTATNGPDDPAADDLLYATDVDDTATVGTTEDGSPIIGPRIDDMGFPSCLYNPHPNPNTPNPGGHGGHAHGLEPEDNLNQAVIEAFGPCRKDTVKRPEATFGGHVAVSGLAFERGDHFPARYDGDLFVAEWGSIWNLKDAEVTGHKLMHVDMAADGKVTRVREFMTGALPIDVTFGPDGTMYVADFAGPIYRVQHVVPTADVVDVEISDFQFTPPVVVVPRGTTVRWTNAAETPHTIDGEAAVAENNPVIRSGNEIDHLELMNRGDTHSYQFDEAGVWKYRCSVHPQLMQGTIVVAPADR